jgi:hypothetical protein
MKQTLLNIKNEISKTAPEPEFELSEAQIERLRKVGEVALAVSMVAGVAALSVVAPNIFVALDKIFGKKQYGSRKSTLERRQEQLTKSFYYLRRQGYINLEKRGELLFVAPTKKGLKRLDRLRFDTLAVKKPRKWAGTWWLVIADVPSKQFRVAADMFQKKLKQMDFYPLQRTVWVHPFDPRRELEDVAAYYSLNPFITMMEVCRLDESDESNLKKFFQEKRLL